MTTSTLGHDEIRDLLAAYALNAVSDDERALVSRHVEGCAECRDELAAHLEALALLTPDEPVPPATATWEAIRERISTEPEATAPTRVISFPRRFLPRFAAAAAIAACSVLVTIAVTRNDGEGTPSVTAPIVSAEPSAQLAGSVKLFEPDSSAGHVVLNLHNVPDAPAGHHYEVWVLRPDEGAEMEAIGAFTPEDGRATLTLSLPGPGEYVALDISLQENAGPPEHSGTSVGGAKLTG